MTVLFNLRVYQKNVVMYIQARIHIFLAQAANLHDEASYGEIPFTPHGPALS